MAWAVQQFFENGGTDAWVVRVETLGDAAALLVSLQQLREIDLFNLLCVPDTCVLSEIDASIVFEDAARLCEKLRAFYIMELPAETTQESFAALTLKLPNSRNAAVYFPQATRPISGAIAGLYARTDATRGVWKAPAGTDAHLVGVADLTEALDDAANERLSRNGINALRVFPNTGLVAWGARTRRGADALADQYKYVPVRRLVLFIEQSVRRGTQWATFEPNDETSWAKLQRDVGAFLHGLWKQGAFQGRSPNESYFVRCDASTTTAMDVEAGILNLEFGVAPSRAGEFIVIVLQYVAPVP
nr:phage tail sheath subtilisin-like domain-containing protein [Lysobacter lactosilyticus]